MSEFKLPPRTLPAGRHDARIMLRVSMAGIVLAFGILFLLATDPHSVVHRFGPLLVWALVLIVVYIVATFFVVLRRELERSRQDLTFVLSEGELIRKRPRSPDVRIPLPQILFLYEQWGCLVVAGGDPPLRLEVPKKVENFKLLKAELLKYAPRSSVPWSYRLKLRCADLPLYIIWGVLVIWSGNVTTKSE